MMVIAKETTVKDSKYEVVNQETGEVIDVSGVREEEPQTRELISFDPSNLEAIHGLKISGDLKFSQRVEVLKQVSSFIGGESSRIDSYLNVPITVCGVVMHDVSVRIDGKVNKDGSDVYVPRTRTVIMVSHKNGKPLPEMIKVAFVAKSADSFFGQTVVPLLGLGMWPEPINLIVSQVPSRRGNAYAFQVI
jgi:hypothetical protein